MMMSLSRVGACARPWLRSSAELLAVWAVLAVLPCIGQQDRGTILGVVEDASGGVIPGAAVTVENQGTGQALTYQTDSAGVFVAPEIPIGTYRVSVSAPGFRKRVQEGIVLRVSDRVQLTLTLQPGDVKETITVTGQTPLIETASTTLGGIIEAGQVRNLPLNGRDPTQLLALVPGVSLRGGFTQLSVNGQNLSGQSQAATTFLMDGVDASRVDSQTPNNTYGRSQNRITRTNAESIQEFRIYENSFSAEYGQSAGSAVNIITRSGTNEFHGSAFEYFRNEKLDARNWFNAPPSYKPAFRLNQFGGSLGGPIRRDSLFFFGSYEGIRQRTGKILSTFVPTEAFRSTLPAELQPVVGMLPLPNGPVSPSEPRVASYRKGVSDLLDEDSMFIRTDYNIDSADRLSFRYNLNSSLTHTNYGVAEGQKAPSYGMLQSSKLTYTRTFGPALLNEAGVAFNRMHIDPRSSVDPKIIAFPITSIGGSAGVGPALFDLLIAANSYTYLDTLSYVKGSHQMKFGAQIIRSQQNKSLFFQKTVNYLNLTDFAQNRPFSIGTLGYPRVGMRDTYYNFFIQDDIRLNRELTLNAGLRYQHESSPSEAHRRYANFNLQTGKLDPPGTAIMDMPDLSFGPRLGLAYSPKGSNRTVLRAGFGVFHVTFNPTLVQNLPNNIFQQSFSLTRIQDPNLRGFPFPQITSFAQTTNLSAIQRDWHTPYTMNWNFNVQQALGGGTRLQVAYVGNRGVHMIGPAMDLNRFLPGTSIRPYAGYGSISYLQPNGFSDYNSLQVSLNRRLAHGLAINVNYVWAHSLDDTPPVFASYQDDHNPRLDYGSGEADVRHLLEFDYVYQLPSAPVLPHWLGGGWQINGITEMRSGFPFSISCGCDPLMVGQATGRADYVAGTPVRPRDFDMPGRQINPAAFAAPAQGRPGTSGRDILRGPAAFNFDFSLFKKFRIAEQQEVEFRSEFFNIFNTPQFTNPSASLAAPAFFGRSLSTINTVSGFGTNRQVQFALRYNF
jgi:hypothetical protein